MRSKHDNEDRDYVLNDVHSLFDARNNSTRISGGILDEIIKAQSDAIVEAMANQNDIKLNILGGFKIKKGRIDAVNNRKTLLELNMGTDEVTKELNRIAKFRRKEPKVKLL